MWRSLTAPARRYLLQLSHGAERWVIMRRYSEWYSLRCELRRKGIGEDLPFPGKRLPWGLCALTPGGKHDPSVISQRTAMLHRWATALLSLEGASEDRLVVEFFELRHPSSMVD